MFDKRVLNIYSIITGVLFIISGFGKVIDTARFGELIFQYGLGYFLILSPVIVIAEIWIGLFLILLINPKRYSFFSFVLLIIFTISFTYAHFKHGVNDCGCFGSLQPSNSPPVLSFIRNLILILMSLVVWIKYPKEKKETPRWKKILIMTILGLSIFASGFTFRTPYFLKGKPEAHKFQNQIITNTELSKYFKTSPDRSYLFFCFSYACPHCWNSIENLRQFKKSNAVDSVVTFVTGKPKDKIIFDRNFHPDFSITELPEEKMIEMVTVYPTAFYVKHDTIKIIIEGELPSPFTFMKTYNLPNPK